MTSTTRAATPGAVAGQDWFVKNMQDALKVIPKEKIICAVGNYGYDWAMKKGQKKGTPPEDVHNVSAQEAWLEASDAETDVNFDDDAMNSALRLFRRKQCSSRCVVSRRSHRAQPDAGGACAGHRHLRPVAAGLGRPFAVGGVGQAFRGQMRPPSSTAVPPGSGRGRSKARARSCASSRDRRRASATSASIPRHIWSATRSSRPCRRPTWSTCMAARSARKLPSPSTTALILTWTPKILDVLKKHGAKATFFLIGAEVEKYPGRGQAHLQRRPRDRQSHLHPPRHQQHLEALLRSRAEPDRAPVREQVRREAGVDAAALRHRRSARYRRPGASAGTGAGPGLHHGGREDRSQRLARQSATLGP